MIRIKKFHLLSGESVADFEAVLNKANADGFMIHGQPFIQDGKFFQLFAEVETQNIQPIKLGAH